MDDALTVPEAGELTDWPVPLLIAYLAAEPTVTTLVVDDTHKFVLRDGDLVAVWTEGVEEQVSAEACIARAMRAPPESSFVVYREQDLLLDRPSGVECPGLRAILVAARGWDDPDRIDAEIEAIVGDTSLCLIDGAVLDEFGFDADESKVVELLVDPGVGDHAHLLERGAPEVVRRVVWALAVTEHLSSVPSTLLLAAEDHEKAQRAFAAGDLDGAEARAARAVACDPRPAYRALHAYLHGLRGPEAALPIAIAMLDRAIADEPERARPYAYRAKLRERAGQTALATIDWAKAHSLDPDDAMISGSSPTQPPSAPVLRKKRGLLESLGALVKGRKK